MMLIKFLATVILSFMLCGCISHNVFKHYEKDSGTDEMVLIWKDVNTSYGTKGTEYSRKGNDVTTKTKDVLDDAKDIVKEMSKVAVGAINAVV